MEAYLFPFLVFAGLFSIAGAIGNWDWFIESTKASLFLKILGRNGTRILYALIGLAILTIVVLLQLGIIESK